MEATTKEHEGFKGVIRPLREEDIPALRNLRILAKRLRANRP